MAQQPYTTGTVGVVDGSATVAGTGVAWLPSIVVQGDMLVVPAQNAVGLVDSVDDTYENITLYSPWTGEAISEEVTISIANPGVVTWNNHNRQANEAIVLGTSGELPPGLTTGTTYYVVGSSITTNTFQLSASPGGAAISTLGGQSVTISIANPGVVTWTAHGLPANAEVVFGTSGALPPGLTAGTPYYVVGASITTNTFQVSATPGGSAINTAGAQAVTISIASPGVITWTGHGLPANAAIVFETSGALPTGLIAGTTYYVVGSSITANTFQVSATSGGAAINTSGSQSGTQTAGSQYGSQTAGAEYGTQTATVTSYAYLILPSSWERFDPSLTQATTRQLLAYLAGAGIIYSVTGASPDPGLGDNGQYALKTNGGEWVLWLKVSGSWVQQGTPAGTTPRGPYNPATPYAANDEVTFPTNGAPVSSYRSLAASNTGNEPDTSPTWWALSASAGANGNTVRYGTGAPSSGLGVNGDFYIDTAASNIYGPKASGAWPSGTSLIGPTGAAGNTVRYGTGAPSSGLGVNGDFYIDTAASNIYGPKASGAWPSGTSLIGPQGNPGTNGTNGNTVLSGSGPPGSLVGNNGDFYYDSAGHVFYGPKASGAWPSGTNLTGPTGGTGATGATGAAGAPGNTVLFGNGAPASTLGVQGNFYIDVAANNLYGPKGSSTWPSPTSMVGPQGIQGVQGIGLTPNATGTLANRAAYDNASPPFIYLETDVSPFVIWSKNSTTTGDWGGPMPIGGTAPVGDLGQVTDTVLETFDYGLAA